MRTPTHRRLFVVILSLAAAGLGCARANVTVAPVIPDYATRQPPAATIAPILPMATVPSPTAEPATTTPEMPPTDTPAGESNPAAATGAPTNGAPTTQPPTATPEPPNEASTAAPALPPSQTPPPLPPTIAPQSIQPMAIPAGATFTRQMGVSSDGGEIIGDPGYLIDNNTATWAALDGGHTAWVFDLGSVKNIGGVRVYAQKPRSGELTTLLAIEVSNDGQNWQPVLVGSGNCGEPNCDLIPQMTFTDIGFTPVAARYLRLRSGPNRFGFAEVAVAVVP